jgi:hypothetical protein
MELMAFVEEEPTDLATRATATMPAATAATMIPRLTDFFLFS